MQIQILGKYLLIGTLTLSLNACVFYPRTHIAYDEECDVLYKKIELETHNQFFASNCSGDKCISKLASLGVVSAVSAVVSGTIVISGNIVYWMERQTQC